MQIRILIFLCLLAGTTGKTQPPKKAWQPILVKTTAVRVPPPPAGELVQAARQVRQLQQALTAADEKNIHYWQAVPPSCRWQEIAFSLEDTAQYWARTQAYVAIAIYDAMVAAVQSVNGRILQPLFLQHRDIRQKGASGQKRFYPCLYSVAAGAASTVLSALFPAKKDTLQQVARSAGRSRVQAGLQYPADVEAGLVLGAAVARQVMEQAVNDGYDRRWNGQLPIGIQYYRGKPLRHDLANTKPLVLQSPSQFRPPPPPDLESDMQLLRNFKPDALALSRAFKWEYSWAWGDVFDKKVLEYGLNNDPLRAAFAYAVMSIADYDNQLAHWDGKYTYFRTRPDQYDTTYKAAFPTPPSPSYPAGHGTMAYTRAVVMSFLFPHDEELFFTMAKEANDSRFEGGVHFRSDNAAGEVLGRKVGAEVVKWARQKVDW